MGEYAKARDAYVKLSATRPNDQTILKLLKDAEARTTMTEGGWEEAAGEKGGFRKLIRDKEAAAKLDMKAKSVVAGSDAEALIAEAKYCCQCRDNTYALSCGCKWCGGWVVR